MMKGLFRVNSPKKLPVARMPTAFTLVELLVIIAIMAILMALLSPALKSAREKARSIACLANLKQIGLGFQMYSNDNGDSIPWHNATGGWSFALDVYVTGSSSSTWYQKKVWCCPANRYAGNGYGSYELNCSLYPSSTESVRTTDIKSPVARLVIADTNAASQGGVAGSAIFEPYSPHASDWTARYAAGFLHSGGANCLFADWHVSWYSEPFMHATDQSTQPTTMWYNW